MVAELAPGRPVFDLVGRPTSRGVTWAWVQDDLHAGSVGRARRDLRGLFAAGTAPHRVLVYLGPERFVDLGGLRLLLEIGGEVRRRGGALAVVAPPHGLTRMAACLALQEEELPMLDSVQEAARWARTRKDA
ncbi:MAG TPA: STAS domain-containing protein [Pseudonocardia sp.]|jgi:hypothetical protein